MKIASMILSFCLVSRWVASEEVRFLEIPHGGIQPQAVRGESGAIHLVYFSGDSAAGDLFHTTSSDGRSAFAEPDRVNTVNSSAIATGTIRGAHLALGKNDRVHVVWMGSGRTATASESGGHPEHPMLHARMKDDRTGFEPERNLMTRTGGLDGGGSVAVDSRGNVYVAWHGKEPGAADGEAGRAVFVSISRDDGKTFAAEVEANPEPTGTCGCCGMRAFADAGDRLHLLYRTANSTSRDMVLLTSSDGGRSFASELVGQWFTQSCPMSSCSMIATSSGLVAGVETEGRPMWRTWDGVTETLGAAVPVSDTRGKHPAMAVNDRGEMLVAWVEGALWGKGGNLMWRKFDQAGAPVGRIESGGKLPAWSFPAVVALDDGFVIIR